FDIQSYSNALSGCVSDTMTTAGFSITGSNNRIDGVALGPGGGGTGAVAPVGFMLAAGFGVLPLNNVVTGTSTTLVPVGGLLDGNTVRVNVSDETIQRPAFASTFTPSVSTGVIALTLTGNITVTAASVGGVNGQKITFVFTQDATGVRSVTFAN